MTRSPTHGSAPPLEPTAHEPTTRHTAAMLVRVTGASTAAIRRWTRRGYLRPDRQPPGVPAYSLVEARVARVLARLLDSGLTLAQVDRVVDRLHAGAPPGCRPLADWDVSLQGRQLVVQSGGASRDPAGQLLLGFDAIESESTAPPAPSEVLLPFPRPAPQQAPPAVTGTLADAGPLADAAAMRASAAELMDRGEHEQAEPLCRGLLFAGVGTAADQLALAECLYRRGDLCAARERYSACLEADPDCQAARLSLGAVYQELGEWDLAAAAFTGVLEQTPDAPDALIPLAEVCDRLGQHERAQGLRRRLLDCLPGGPWADDARARLGRDAAGGVVENPLGSPILQGS